jgi:ribosomal protein L24
MIIRGICGKSTPEYVGCVLNTYEHNGRWDSYWHAFVWDEKSQSVKEVLYDTTSAGGGGCATIDATQAVVRKAYRYYKRIGKQAFDSGTNPAQAKEVCKGDEVMVVRGRKIPKGTTGKVFWRGTRYNSWSHQDEERVGVECASGRVFLPLAYVDVVNWEAKLIHGKERKRRIRDIALGAIPVNLRDLLEARA